MLNSAMMSKDLLSVLPEIRVGLVGPSPKVLKLLACAVSVHHAIKLQHLEVALLAHSESDLLPLVNLVLKMAEMH